MTGSRSQSSRSHPREDAKVIAQKVTQQVKQIESRVDSYRRKKSAFRDYMMRKKSTSNNYSTNNSADKHGPTPTTMINKPRKPKGIAVSQSVANLHGAG